jgi:hypothetical protein
MYVFPLRTFFSSNQFSKIWFPWVPLEITVRNEVPARIFSLKTSFLTVIPRRILGIIFYWELVARKKWLSVEIRAIK